MFFLLFSMHFDRDTGQDYGRLSLNHPVNGCRSIWVATSAVATRQEAEGFHQRYGMIPPCYRTKNANPYRVDTKPYFLTTKGVEGNFYCIHPITVYTDKGGVRSEFGIHRDANVVGSEGCIVLTGERFKSFEQEMSTMLNTFNLKQLPLFVQYS
jgi:hypothetical protein